MTRFTVSLATLIVTFLLCRGAEAQRLVMQGGLGIGTGLQRSDLIEEKLFQRARTRLIVPFTFRNDEDMGQALSVVGLLEIEPKVSFGLEARYVRWLGRVVSGFVGVPVIIAPKSLVGVSAGVDLDIPLGTSVSLFVEPSIAAMPLGADLPGNHVLIWGLIAAGVHAHF